MQLSSRVVDLIQACCLLSLYYLSNGRFLEGSYYSAAASTLAVQCRLHQIGCGPPTMNLDIWDATFDLPPPKDNIERGERITTFWQVYNLDRCWSVVLRRPATLPDSDHPLASITTPWPQRIEDYENVSRQILRICEKYQLINNPTGGPRRGRRLAYHPGLLCPARAVDHA